MPDQEAAKTLVHRIPHDQIVKELLLAFLPELVELACPGVPRHLLSGDGVPVSQESFTATPRGAPRYSDVAVRFQGALVLHAEGQEEDRKDDPLDDKMLQHATALVVRHPEKLLSIALCFFGSKRNEPIGPVRLERAVDGAEGLGFTYYRIDVPALDAAHYLSGENPLCFALAARMHRGRGDKRMSRALLKAECIRRIAGAKVSDRQGFLLLHFVTTYLKLDPDEQKEYDHMMEQEEYAGARTIQRTWSEEMIDEGERRGREQGRDGMKYAIAALCEVLGIELTADRSAQVARMDVAQLTSLCTYIKSHRAWPKA
jgi:hypothetical protein